MEDPTTEQIISGLTIKLFKLEEEYSQLETELSKVKNEKFDLRTYLLDISKTFHYDGNFSNLNSELKGILKELSTQLDRLYDQGCVIDG